MSNPIESGDKVHIITRRLFADDIRRHFAGEVISSGNNLFGIKGYAFVYSAASDKYQKRPKLRSRIFSLADGIHIVNKLPPDVDIESLHYNTIDGRLIITDMKDFSLDVNEFSMNN